MKKMASALLALFLIVSVIKVAPQRLRTRLCPPRRRPRAKNWGMPAPTLQAEFFISLTNSLKERFEAKGYTLTVMSYDGDINKSISIVENFTIQGVDGIIAMVGDNSADAALKAAMDKGIKVIDAGVLTEHYDLGLVADNKDIGTRIGEMAAEYINNELGGKARSWLL